MDVSTLLKELGSTPSATARLTGLSRMTVLRVRDGISSPALSTLRELALAAGYDLDLSLVPASDPAAAVAARVLLDPSMPSCETVEEVEQSDRRGSGQIALWIARLGRHGSLSPRELLALAGKYAAPQHRKGARFFSPRPGLAQEQIIKIAASAAEHAGGTSALSGVAASLAYLDHAPDPGPLVIWASDVDIIAERLGATFREADQFQPGGIIVAPTLDAYFVDTLTRPIAEYTIVSPIQLALDLYGLGYTELADSVTEGW